MHNKNIPSILPCKKLEKFPKYLLTPKGHIPCTCLIITFGSIIFVLWLLFMQLIFPWEKMIIKITLTYSHPIRFFIGFYVLSFQKFHRIKNFWRQREQRHRAFTLGSASEHVVSSWGQESGRGKTCEGQTGLIG